ncbi:cyclopropane-fatty-acyl-phospholipid synthase [Amylibacter ulvae]|uniref:Cyclopropane-fatty-acyl-phospholipid synthase n=1 Tax=Paramylibacter ulvae TaxID=1651968 RepID=A0ABQ3D419_9RHOB|nr:cyclopropane-fatty-acyl-phospholipid synthase family protein [Amylibacter ulvae]GHA57678.1 cyclopropane-fatty-acyl-phospholipid synthase [Amylibacter ulvae]
MWTALFKQMLGKMIQHGQLEVHLADGQKCAFGDGSGKVVTLTFHDPALPRKIIQNPDLAVGEAYTDGRLTIANDDLYGFVALAIRNIARNSGRFANSTIWWQRPLVGLRKSLRRLEQRNILGRAQENVAHHYDLSEDLYRLFLDEDLQYSCGYFKTPDDSLELAQVQKKAHIAAKLELSPEQRVLDIGCGWGGMALTLARDYGVNVVGVTLSREQHRVACQRAKDMGLDGQVEFRLMDYRDLDEPFDRIVSVGMFEHVGVPHYPEYFAKIRKLLVSDGVALIHTIGRAGPPNATSKWILKYIFPGGYVPAMSEALTAIENENMLTADIEIWRLHYAETIRHWRARFEANIDAATNMYDTDFCRMWRYYLAVSEASFRNDRQVVFQFQLTKDLNSLPITRDYLYGRIS